MYSNVYFYLNLWFAPQMKQKNFAKRELQALVLKAPQYLDGLFTTLKR